VVLLVHNLMDAYPSTRKIQLWAGGYQILAVNEFRATHIRYLLYQISEHGKEPRKCHSTIGQEYVIAVQQSRGLSCIGERV
jgi:hypothetical protein